MSFEKSNRFHAVKLPAQIFSNMESPSNQYPEMHDDRPKVVGAEVENGA